MDEAPLSSVELLPEDEAVRVIPEGCLICVQDLHTRLGNRKILNGMDFVVKEGETFVIMGGSGGGKSVTLKHIIGVFKPDRGRVIVDGKSVGDLDRVSLMDLRKEMGYLFQSGALINWLTVFENVALPLREHTKLRESEIRDRVHEVVSVVEMEHALDQFPDSISGGMKKRAGLARALVTKPKIVLYDEPNAGLDPVMSETINRLIVDVQNKLGVTSVVVTHRRACAFTVADRIAVIERGRIVDQGTQAEMRRSEHPLTKKFLSPDVD
ncbi:MAG: ABC transporter ATP-binding protein [Deltaproteobacteria bacterium]|nr:MAG: ABC transporter ATP-binding protein [Deltaproteobacteria bacterium]